MYLQEDMSLLPSSLAPAVSGWMGAVRLCDQEQLAVTVLVRRRPLDGVAGHRKPSGSGCPGHRQYLSRLDFDSRHGASERDLDQVTDFGRAHELQVLERNALRRRIVWKGTAQQITRAFSVEHEVRPCVTGSERTAWSWLRVPAELDGIVDTILEPESLGRMAAPWPSGPAFAHARKTFPLRGGYPA